MPRVNRWLRLMIVAALALLVGSAYYAIQSHRKHEQVRAWANARPTEFRIDLSKPGITRAPFHQSYDESHSECVSLVSENAPHMMSAALAEQLTGLSGELVILANADGREVYRRAISAEPAFKTSPPSPFGVASFKPFPQGEYTIICDIHQGAPALLGVPMRFQASYELCGMEMVPAAIDGLFCLGLGVLGVTVGVWAGVRFVTAQRNGRMTVLVDKA